MRNNKSILVILSTFILCSCSHVKYNVNDLTFNESNLSFMDFSNVSGHRYKYKHSPLSNELGNKCLDLYKHIGNSNFDKTDATDAEGFEGILWYTVMFKSDKNYYIDIDSENIYQVRLKINIITSDNSDKYKIYSYKINDEETKKMIDNIVPTFESILSNIDWTY